MQASASLEAPLDSVDDVPLSETRRRTPAPKQRSAARRIELPTLAIAFAIYGGWLLLVALAPRLPWWALAPFGGFLVAWHGSLQHETIHGHPTRSRWFNTVVGSIPLSLWLPYGVYRRQHLVHHRVAVLTDPLEDPESFYVTAETWEAAGPLKRVWLRVQMTLVGRLVFGPPVIVARFFAEEARRILAGDRTHLRAWLVHIASVALLVAWLTTVCHVSVLRYVLCVAYPGLALSLLRSFTEHRPAAFAAERVAIVEGGWLSSLLFLNNNLHAVHHDEPALPWYELRDAYRAHRSDILEANGNFVFDSYVDVAFKYAFRSKDSPVHPATRGNVVAMTRPAA